MQETCRLERTAPYVSLQFVLYVEVTPKHFFAACKKEK